jgi:hypothetical protein
MWQQRHRTERSEAGRISSPRETRSLFAAIHASATLDVQRLVEEERQDVNQSDALGWSPLHHAAFLGQVKIAEILLRNGANVNAQNRDGYTPLHLAVANSKQKVATLLLKYQADPTIKDFYGRTVMDVSPLENGKITRLIEEARKSPPRLRTTRHTPQKRRFSSPSKIRQRLTFSQDFNEIDFDRKLRLQNVNNVNNHYYLCEFPSDASNISPATSFDSESLDWKTRFWITAKRVATWQIIRYIVQILLCLLLEFFVDHLKRVLQIVVLLTPLEVFYIVINPIRILLEPIRVLLWPWLQPIFGPLWGVLSTLLAPIFDLLWSILSLLSPIFSFVAQILLFLVTRTKIVIRPFVTVLNRALVDPVQKLLASFGSLLSAIFSPLLSLLTRISQPLWDIFKALGSKIFSSLNVYIQKLIQKIFQALQPMMNISGFLSRVFNVLVAGLKAILHWFLPVSLLEEIHSISLKIFGHPQHPTPQQFGSTKLPQRFTTPNTEETALMVIFAFVIVIYGSIFIWGYIFKLVLFILCLQWFHNPIFDAYAKQMLHIIEFIGVLYKTQEITTTVSPTSIVWLLTPDLLHHQLGITLTTTTIAVILLYKLVKFLFYLFLWVRSKCTKFFARNKDIIK